MDNTVRIIGTVEVPFDIALEGVGKLKAVSQKRILAEVARLVRAGIKVNPEEVTITNQDIDDE